MHTTGEQMFTIYFDIVVGAKAGTEVTSRQHPISNNDFIASNYTFTLLNDASNLFNINTVQDC